MDEVRRDLSRRYTDALQDIVRTVGARGSTPQALESATLYRLRERSSAWFVSGISGSGKSTIVEALAKAGYGRLPNVVTRARRSEEKNTDSVFTDDVTFLKWQSEGLIFHPHKTNGVWHGILTKDIRRLLDGSSRLYADKSVASALEIVREYPHIRQSNFLYILAPSFDVLMERLLAREKRADGGGMRRDDINARLDEEIEDMARSIQLPYAYVVNDVKERVAMLIKKYV